MEAAQFISDSDAGLFGHGLAFFFLFKHHAPILVLKKLTTGPGDSDEMNKVLPVIVMNVYQFHARGGH